MAATLVQIVEAVVTSLNAATFSAPYASITAVRRYQPEFKLPELADLKVSVVPAAMQSVTVSRNTSQNDFRIEIGIQKHTDGSQSAIDDLVLLAGEIADHCIRLDLLSGDARVISVEAIPMDQGQMKYDRVFTWVVNVNVRTLGHL